MAATPPASEKEEGPSSRLPPLSSRIAMPSPLHGDGAAALASSSSLTRLPSASKTDVTLPCIRSLGAFDGDALPPIRPPTGSSAEVLPPPPQPQQPQQYSAASSSSSSSPLPPLPKFADPRSRAEGVKSQLASSTHRRTSPSSPSHHPDPSKIESASHDHYRRPANAPDGAPSYQHPFFDLKPYDKDGNVAKRESEDSERAMLMQAYDSLNAARNIVHERLNRIGHSSQEALDFAIEACGRACSLLNDLGQNSPTRSQSHDLRLRNAGSGTSQQPSTYAPAGNAQSPALPRTLSADPYKQGAKSMEASSGYSWDAKPHYPAPSGSIWALNRNRDRPHATTAAPASSQVSPRKFYEGQDSGANDGVPRPPASVFHVNNSAGVRGLEQPPRSDAGSESEASYMFAPPSIRNRLAALHKPAGSPNPEGHAESSHLPGTQSESSSWAASPQTSSPESKTLRPYSPSMDSASAATYQDDAAERRSTAADAGTKYKKRSRAPAPAACKNCGTNETPEWRRGPDGARTLCNACGLHFAKLAKRKGPDGSSEENSVPPQASMPPNRVLPPAHPAYAPPPPSIHARGQYDSS